MLRGRDFFIREDEADWVRSFDRLVIQWQHTRMTAANPRDFDRNPMTDDECRTLYLAFIRENAYDLWRMRQDEEQQGQRVFWKGVDPLNIDSLEVIEYNRPKLQPFKMKYDTLEEVRMRFNKTVILIKGNPFGVSDQRIVKDQFYLLLEDAQQVKSYVSVDDIPDLRPAAPGYVRVGDSNGYFMRSPARVNQQGMTSNSVQIKAVGGKGNLPFSTPLLVDALSTRGKTLPWEGSYRKLIDDRIVSTLRLSDTLAVYKKPGMVNVIVEYKGRRLGELHDHTVKLFDEDDDIQPWLKSEVKKVNLEVRA